MEKTEGERMRPEALVDDVSRQTELEREILPVQDLEEKYGVDIFRLRREWFDKSMDVPGALLREFLASPLPPGALMAILGLCPLEQAETPEARKVGEEFLKNAAAEAEHIPDYVSYEGMNGVVPSIYTGTAKRIMGTLSKMSLEFAPRKEETFRARQQELRDMLTVAAKLMAEPITQPIEEPEEAEEAEQEESAA